MIDSCSYCKAKGDPDKDVLQAELKNGDWRVPFSAAEIKSALEDGVAVHDLDGDCIGEYGKYLQISDMVRYKLVAGQQWWDRPLDYIRVPTDYVSGVTDEQVNAAVASILGTIEA